jgi:hypothetical protein
METTSIDKLAKQGQAVAAKAADMASDLGRETAPILNRASSQTQTAGKWGISALGDMVSHARDAATDASDTVLAYTKKNPAKALGIAAVAGALLFAIAKANAMRRD